VLSVSLVVNRFDDTTEPLSLIKNLLEEIPLEKIELKATVRTKTGKGPARVLRREGKIPAVLYGRGTASVLLSIDARELEQISKRHNLSQVLLSLVIKDGKSVTKRVMIKELQAHPVSLNFVHVDFYEIAMDRKVTVNVPVVTTGKAKGVEVGGILQIVRRDLEILCLPDQIPESIVIDITDLDIGDSVHVKEIAHGREIEILADTDFTVLTILSPKLEVEEEVEEEEEEMAEAEAAEGEAETPETAEEE
jgi:large subunit ribosomal protein L25